MATRFCWFKKEDTQAMACRILAAKERCVSDKIVEEIKDVFSVFSVFSVFFCCSVWFAQVQLISGG